MMNVVRSGALDGCTGLPKNLVSAWLGRKLTVGHTVRPNFYVESRFSLRSPRQRPAFSLYNQLSDTKTAVFSMMNVVRSAVWNWALPVSKKSLNSKMTRHFRIKGKEVVKQ